MSMEMKNDSFSKEEGSIFGVPCCLLAISLMISSKMTQVFSTWFVLLVVAHFAFYFFSC